MTEEEWNTSSSADEMLSDLRRTQPDFLTTQVPQLHRFLIACCWKYQNLIPQPGLRKGLQAAERWIAGDIDDAELAKMNWYAEADAFAIDYATSPNELAEVESLIAAVDELRSLSFDEARKILLAAAYFAEGAMIYPTFQSLPWVRGLFTSQFLCPKLLRAHVKPSFAP